MERNLVKKALRNNLIIIKNNMSNKIINKSNQGEVKKVISKKVLIKIKAKTKHITIIINKINKHKQMRIIIMKKNIKIVEGKIYR
jgi:hypothetical protein